MIDMDHFIGNDLSVGPTGDIAWTQLTKMGEQRVMRRLITNAGDYIWHLDYGGGIGKMIGTPANVPFINGIILAQMSKETAVSQTPPPVITVTANDLGVVAATIQYVDANTGANTVLNVPPVG